MSVSFEDYFDCYFPGWPLVMYRELAVHLAQVTSLTTHIRLREGKPFDYVLDQVDYLRVGYTVPAKLELLGTVLCYYAQAFPEIAAQCLRDGKEALFLKNQTPEVIGAYLAPAP